VEYVGYGLLALAAAGLGALGGLGGAILLVPVLVLTGMSPRDAAPLGLLTVASGSVAAGPHQLRSRLVNHRLGMVIELAAAIGAVTGALMSGLISESLLTWVLAAVALGSAAVGLLRRGKVLRNPPDPACSPADVGERVGRLDGAYPLGDGVVPYRPRRLWEGIGFMGVAGMVAGTAGVSGGFIKTPVLTELMRVPLKVAAATSTFTVGITASAALIVFAVQGRIDVQPGALVITGSLLGGALGARAQSMLPSWIIRRVLSVILVAVALSLVARA
jgi:uncharacterized protein